MSENPYGAPLRKSRKIVADMLSEDEFESILEVGAQWGENLVAIRERFPTKRIVGVDADWDGILEEAKVKTQLDLRKGDVRNLEFEREEFDIVFTNALLCMLKPHEIEKAVQNLIRVAKKKIILIEFFRENGIGLTKGGRVAGDWKKLFNSYDYRAQTEIPPKEIWGIPEEDDKNPWLEYGSITTVEIE